MVRMEEAVVKQGFLHLQQHQTFGKVREQGWAGQNSCVEEGGEFPGQRGSLCP